MIQGGCTASRCSLMSNSAMCMLHIGHSTMTFSTMTTVSSSSLAPSCGDVLDRFWLSLEILSTTAGSAFRLMLAFLEVSSSSSKSIAFSKVLPSNFSFSLVFVFTQPSSLFFCKPALSFLLIASFCFLVSSGSWIFVYVPPHSSSCLAHQVSLLPGARFMVLLTSPKYGGWSLHGPSHCQTWVL